MVEYSFSTKSLSRGDKVIDLNRIIHREGYIISGVFSTAGDGSEVIEQAFVEFGSKVYTAWYDSKTLQSCWVESEQAYIIEEE